MRLRSRAEIKNNEGARRRRAGGQRERKGREPTGPGKDGDGDGDGDEDAEHTFMISGSWSLAMTALARSTENSDGYRKRRGERSTFLQAGYLTWCDTDGDGDGDR